MSASVEDLLEHYESLPASKRAELDQLVDRRSAGQLWIPTVGPQLSAKNSEADILLYGGEGGGGKTDLGLGLAFTEHERSLVIRHQYTDLRGITDRAKEINGTDKGYNGSSPPRLTTVNKKIIDFGALSEDGSEEAWQGQPHDLIYIDEVVQNREHQVRFLFS